MSTGRVAHGPRPGAGEQLSGKRAGNLYNGQMTAGAKLTLVVFAIAATVDGLSAQECSAFDVASIKLNTSGAGGGYPEVTPGSRRFIATNQLMIELLMTAYDVPPLQISGIPSAFLRDRFDVDATCEQLITKERLPRLLQLLLADRFHLSVHRESREQTVYALVPWKGGPRIRQALQQGGKPVLKQSGYTFTFTSADMSKLVGVLSQLAGRKVVDRTRLSGQYDFTLSYAPDQAGAGKEGSSVFSTADGLPDSVFTALREQLGLNLEAQKSQVEFIVVDRMERLIPN